MDLEVYSRKMKNNQRLINIRSIFISSSFREFIKEQMSIRDMQDGLFQLDFFFNANLALLMDYLPEDENSCLYFEYKLMDIEYSLNSLFADKDADFIERKLDILFVIWEQFFNCAYEIYNAFKMGKLYILTEGL